MNAYNDFVDILLHVNHHKIDLLILRLYLPLNQLKINKNFVTKLDLNSDVAVIVKTIITIARNFGIEVIAQGVETDRQFAFLQQYGCNLFQGFLFGKPLPLHEFTQSHSFQRVCFNP